MPRQETVLTVFVASPGDVSDERDLMQEVVDEVNRLNSKRTSVRLELLKWETDVYPGFGADPQAVINDQVPEDYDVFIGILWNTLGTPTERADSGTVEEFEKAKTRYDNDHHSVWLMLYFKDAVPLSMSDIDPDQLKKVREFKERVGNTSLYSEFVSTDDFTNKIRVHLTQFVQAWRDRERKPLLDQVSEVTDTDKDHVSHEGSEDCLWNDQGILDLEDTFEEEMHELTAVLGRMSGAIEDIGDNMVRRSQELQTLPGYGVENLSFQKRQRFRLGVKRVLRNSSDDMNDFVKRMRVELPLFRQHLDQGLSTFLKAVPMYLEIYDEDGTQELEGIVTTLFGSIDGMLESMEGFHASVSDLPRMTTAMVRSQRETKKVLQEVIDISLSGKASLSAAMELLP